MKHKPPGIRQAAFYAKNRENLTAWCKKWCSKNISKKLCNPVLFPEKRFEALLCLEMKYSGRGATGVFRGEYKINKGLDSVWFISVHQALLKPCPY